MDYLDYLLMQATIAEYHRALPRHRLPAALRQEQKDDTEAIVLRRQLVEQRLDGAPAWRALF